MAMPQRDDPPSRKRFLLRTVCCGGQDGGPGALLEYAVMHNDEAEAARLRAELKRHTETI